MITKKTIKEKLTKFLGEIPEDEIKGAIQEVREAIEDLEREEGLRVEGSRNEFFDYLNSGITVRGLVKTVKAKTPPALLDYPLKEFILPYKKGFSTPLTWEATASPSIKGLSSKKKRVEIKAFLNNVFLFSHTVLLEGTPDKIKVILPGKRKGKGNRYEYLRYSGPIKAEMEAAAKEAFLRYLEEEATTLLVISENEEKDGPEEDF
jgi:hypothetical protein